MLDIKRVLEAKPKNKPVEELTPLCSPFGEEVKRQLEQDANYVPRSKHPRPQFARGSYRSLNGRWHCAFSQLEYSPNEDAQNVVAAAVRPSTISEPIIVPFSPESDLSGVGKRLDPNMALWYRGEFEAPHIDEGQRCILHFDGVDDTCAVWCNGSLLGTHSGGYLPFNFDITDKLNSIDLDNHSTGSAASSSALTFSLELCVVDPTEQGVQLRGKQTINRSDLWYSAQSGIWQPVWIEIVPVAHILSAEITPDANTGELEISAKLKCGISSPNANSPQCLHVEVLDNGQIVSQTQISQTQISQTQISQTQISQTQRAQTQSVAQSGENDKVRVKLKIENPHLWSPDDPFLYTVVMRFGEDVVNSYCAFRTVEVRSDARGTMRFFLNGKPFFMRGVLDQGYWPESHMTAPNDEAFVFDIEQMKECGFNALRMHIKIESERFYYHCDRLGMLVWQDMVTGGGTYNKYWHSYIPTLFKWSWGHYSDKSKRHMKKLSSGNARYRSLWTQTCASAVELLKNHPSVCLWVLFNEGWGQFDSAAACEMVCRLDKTRPIEAVSGWYDQGAGDFYGIHNYFRDMVVFRDRKGQHKGKERAFVTCEFGGLVHNVAGHSQLSRSFGYDVYDDIKSLKKAVRKLLKHMNNLEHKGMSGYIYTQLSDVEEETNGILTYDRRVNKLVD